MPRAIFINIHVAFRISLIIAFRYRNKQGKGFSLIQSKLCSRGKVGLLLANFLAFSNFPYSAVQYYFCPISFPGKPTIEKCKKLRKKMETKKEVSELDLSNIIAINGNMCLSSIISHSQTYCWWNASLNSLEPLNSMEMLFSDSLRPNSHTQAGLGFARFELAQVGCIFIIPTVISRMWILSESRLAQLSHAQYWYFVLQRTEQSLWNLAPTSYALQVVISSIRHISHPLLSSTLLPAFHD